MARDGRDAREVCAEVAAAVGVSVAAAKSRIHRGRLQLRDLLEGHGES